MSFQRIINALRYSSQGLRSAWRDEAAFRQELLGFVLISAVTIPLDLPRAHLALLIGLMFGVLALELLNSGLEALVDKTSPEKHHLAGKAKDCGSAAVLLGMCGFAVAWAMLAAPLAWARLHQLFA